MCFTWLRSKLGGAAPAMALRPLEGRYAARAAPAAAPAPPFRIWRRENGVDRKLESVVMESPLSGSANGLDGWTRRSDQWCGCRGGVGGAGATGPPAVVVGTAKP